MNDTTVVPEVQIQSVRDTYLHFLGEDALKKARQLLPSIGEAPNNIQAVTVCILAGVPFRTAAGMVTDAPASIGYAFCSGKDEYIELEGQLKALERALHSFPAPSETDSTYTDTMKAFSEKIQRTVDWGKRVDALKTKLGFDDEIYLPL